MIPTVAPNPGVGVGPHCCWCGSTLDADCVSEWWCSHECEVRWLGWRNGEAVWSEIDWPEDVPPPDPKSYHMCAAQWDRVSMQRCACGARRVIDYNNNWGPWQGKNIRSGAVRDF